MAVSTITTTKPMDAKRQSRIFIIQQLQLKKSGGSMWWIKLDISAPVIWKSQHPIMKAIT